MARILLWRLAFEGLEFLKWLGFRGRDSFYFAFGGNLDSRVRQERRIEVFSEEFWALHDYELVFDHQGPFEGAGFASLRAQPGKSVWGKVYRIPRIDAWRMHYFEAALFLTKYRAISGEYKDGRALFFYQTVWAREGLLPTVEYKESLLTGYIGCPEACLGFVETLKQWPCVADERPVKEINFLWQDYGVYGALCRPILKFYDELAFKLFLALYVGW